MPSSWVLLVSQLGCNFAFGLSVCYQHVQESVFYHVSGFEYICDHCRFAETLGSIVSDLFAFVTGSVSCGALVLSVWLATTMVVSFFYPSAFGGLDMFFCSI